ncbi:hypothetical protein PVAP13_1NG083500 [Panicum virgatum]|uniref:Protein TIC 21, chloroplastic n=1 Tax=Panicum virgatum TaxID=38727 RepID=A0A8T0WPQ7_PANVG|nr:hypothetical protein PVAP13_1NG083500 [Panicum virgatum]
MQALLLPARPAPPPAAAAVMPSAYASQARCSLLGAAGRLSLGVRGCARRPRTVAAAPSSSSSSPGPLYPTPPPTEQEVERVKLEQVMRRLEKTARYFKNLGTFGFWSQLVCTIVSAGILSFSTVVTGKVTAPFTFYATAAGIAAAFISVFWSFGYIRLSERLRRTAKEPDKATVGALVAKALTTSSVPYYQASQSPVLALDVFLVQASANTILSHFLGLASSLELLRSVSLPPPAEAAPAPAAAPARA